MRKPLASGISRTGINRPKNDDRFITIDLDENYLLLAVCDGLGGHPDGDIAAEDIIGCLKRMKFDRIENATPLSDAIHQADLIIRKKITAAPDLEGMGATVTAAVIGPKRVYWAHIGDSRMYLMRNNIIRQVTRDHTFLQDLIDWGDVPLETASKHPMSHVLDQCVGCIDNGIDSGDFERADGDILILCTDGLHGVVSEEQMAEIILSSKQLSRCSAGLFEAAVHGGSLDDITIVLASS
ncbi:protein-serine/threonine phosphatase [Desulfomarina profundi]|uniref:Protein-serine/threonine phosphatase n=1 Tax=Desulfomarina profundi TaxID=2772557 RepID=A0A8D5FPM7_9BACT|nr:protein phosphatase 2C domain-containing protein [Desulfomarina profundi]BCL61440.1 protein-serine/threonine phosphatase [Desulfomarina profundi]